MKTRLLSLVLALCLSLGLAAPALALAYGEEYVGYDASTGQQYHDVPTTHWAAQSIATCSQRTWFNGYPDGTFRPDGLITREEAAKVFAVAMGLEVAKNPTVTFTDTKGTWASAYIEAAKPLFPNVANLQGTASFRPTQTITREEAIYALVVAWGYGSKATNADLSILNMFSDTNSISAGVKPYMAVAVAEGLVAGLPDGTIAAQKGLTRAEFATLLARALSHGYGPDSIVAPAIDQDETTQTPEPTPSAKPSQEPEQKEDEWIIDPDRPVIEAGKCGEDVYWVLYEDNCELVIAGKGRMDNYKDSDNAPWSLYQYQIRSLTVKDGVTSLGDFAFGHCKKLTTATLANTVTSLGAYTFVSSGLISIDVPDSVTSIGEGAFSASNLTSLDVPDSVTNIESGAFSFCPLTRITLPSKLQSISDSMLGCCSNLTWIAIPKSVTTIGQEAFYSCLSLTDVYYAGDARDWAYVSIAKGNGKLTDATIHFNSTGK